MKETTSRVSVIQNNIIIECYFIMVKIVNLFQTERQGSPHSKLDKQLLTDVRAEVQER